MTLLPHLAPVLLVTAGAALCLYGMALIENVIPSAKVKEARA